MGILNVTPDSFSDGGKYNTLDTALYRVEEMLDEGADIIDIGGYSSRPGAEDISAAEEHKRLQGIVPAIIQRFPEAILSIDTFRSSVARAMLEQGAHIINDISGGVLDPAMMALAREYQAPYILMHMKGTPQTMQQQAHYTDVVEEVWDYFVERLNIANKIGLHDVIIDMGLGFAKQPAHSYTLLARISRFLLLQKPLLVGISRKSMLYKTFQTTSNDVEDAAAALHLHVLQAGASILRVHDVKSAARIRHLHSLLSGTI